MKTQRILSIAILLLASGGVCRAQSGTWTNDASSVWSAPANWLNATVANGSGNTADFTLNNANVDTVTLDTSRSLEALLFGNSASSTLNSWILNASGGSVLTLAGGTPTITVNNGVGAFTNQAILALPLAGTSGLTKAGAGTLALGGTNSYSGATAISAGTLKLTNNAPNAASSNAPVLYFSFDNVISGTVINQGTGGAAMNGTLLGSASIVPGGRYGNALYIPPGVANFNYVLVNSSVVPLTVPSPNAWTVAMWLQTSTAGGAYFYQGSGSWATGNTEFYLENGTAGDGAGSFAGGVRNSQGWESGTTVINDGAWHFVVMTCAAATKTLYVDGAVDAFTAGVNQWGGNGAGTQVRIGGAAGTADSQIALNGLIDEVYMYNRALGQAEIQALMSTASGPTWLTPLPAASAVTVTAPAKLDMNGNTAITASLSGSGTVDNTQGSGRLVVNATSDVEFDGLLTNAAGTLSLTKLGPATLTLGGINMYTGGTAVGGGKLNITGALEAPTNTATNGMTMTVGNGAGNAVLSFSGTFLSNFNYNIGSVTNAVGAFYQTAGYMTNFQGANGSAFQLGSAPGAYGYYYIGAGASMGCGEIGVGGEVQPSGNGLMEVNGGTVTDTGYLVMARNGTGTGQSLIPQTGILNVYSGTLLFGTVNGGGLQCNWGSAGTSIVNVLGGTLSTSINQPISLNNTGNVGNAGFLNLNGGIAQAGWVTGGPNNTRVSFNGGTLQANEPQAVMMTNLASACVYSGGGTINNNGFPITIGQPLLAPAGNGVNSITSFTGGAGYIAPPMVAVVPGLADSTGVGATAIAQINPATGVVTNVLITCPGVNYTATPTFTLTGGGATTAATITGAPPTPNASGGLTFSGSGITTLTGGYTCTNATIIQGGTLSLGPTAVTPSAAGPMTIGANASLTVDASSGTTFTVGSLTMQNNATNGFNYGTVIANPATAAINVAGNLSLPGSAIIINITAIGLKLGEFPLIKYTGTPPLNIDNLSLGPLQPGVVANLVNNTGNHSIDINITGTAQNLSWYGLLPDGVNVSSNWDITLTTNWVGFGTTTPALRYQEYTSGGITQGDTVTFGDTVASFNGTPVTSIYLAAAVRPFQFLVNSTSQQYSFFGPGGLVGSEGVVMSGSSFLTLGTSNNYTGGTFINSGTVVVTNSYGLGAASSPLTLAGGTLQAGAGLTNTGAVSLTANSTVDVLSGLTARFNGPVSGSGGLTVIDPGTVVLAGTSSYTGATTVNGGTLNYLGPFGIAPATAANQIIVNNTGVSAAVSIGTGANIRFNNNNPLIGNNASGAGALIQTGGTISGINQLQIGAVTGGSFGYYSLSGSGVANLVEFDLGGFNGAAVGVFDMSGGTMNVTNWIVPSRGTGGTGILNMTGGTLKYLGPAGQFVGNWNGGSVGTFVINVAASSLIASNANLNTMQTGGSGKLGEVNLLTGGVLQVNSMAPGSTLGTNILNFNGGTLKATAANANFLTASTGVNVFSGGGTIDNNGVAITIPARLSAPAGNGLNSAIAMSSAGTGYIGAPAVTFSGDGVGASGYATIANGGVTGIVITSPGTGYTSAPGVNLTGGGNGDAFAAPIATPTANTSGGMTFKGTGVTTLTGVNTFTGPITNLAGTLALNSASTYSGSAWVNGGSLQMTTASQISGNVTVSNTAVLGIAQVGTGTETIGNLTLGVATLTNGATLSLSYANGNTVTPLLNCGTLTLNGTNFVSIAGRFTVGVVPLVHYTSLVAGTASVFSNNIIGPQGLVAALSNSVADSTLYAVITSTGPGLVWTGTNGNPALTNVWDIGLTTNWLLVSTPATYQETVPPGDVVTFNDAGSGRVTVSNTVSPFSLLISNNAVNYTFQGSGHIAGSTGITKLGSGTATLTLTNDGYAGDTVISNGTLVAGSATALSSAANLNLGHSGLLELNGFSEGVNVLSGSGVIDDNSVNSPTLTVNGGGTWNGTISNNPAVSSGLSLTKTGNNTMVIGGTNILNAGSGGNGGFQVNGGTLIITNGGVVGVGNAEFWIAQGANTANVIVAGGKLIVSNNWLVVGRNNAAANGTLIVNSGLVQKAGANNIVIGSLGATGTLIVNGGTVLNNGLLFVGEGSTANATLQLNGGLIQATQLHPNNNGGLPAASTAYFNGGTLQASDNSTDFIQCSAVIQTNGLILDDGGFTITISSQALVADSSVPAGGLTKTGAGTVYLDTGNSYTGTTVVNNGTLAGSGSITGPVVVAAGGSIGAGDAGAVGRLAVNSQLTIQGKAIMRINKTGNVRSSDLIAGIGTLHYGGTLVISNVTSDATPLAVGDQFTLFAATAPSGNFGLIPGSAGTGLAYSFNPASGILSVVTGPATSPPNMTFNLSGSSLTLSWPADHQGWILQSNSINVAIPGDWYPIPGSASVTSESYNVDQAHTNVFYRLILQ